MMRRINEKRKRSVRPQSLEITLTPLIDAVLVLLIIFMVAMPIIQNAIKVELPTSSTNDAQERSLEPVTVYFDKARRLFIEDKEVSLDDLLKVLDGVLREREGDDHIIMVKADQSVSYGDVVKIVDDIKYLGGVKYVALATEKR